MHEVIIDHLTAIGADGLCNTDNECGCGLDDYRPCTGGSDRCKPAIKHTITKEDLDSGLFFDGEVGDTVYRAMTEPKHDKGERHAY